MLLTLCMIGTLTLNAQGYRRAGTSTQVHAMYKDELKAKLGLPETKAMNVDAIQQDYVLKMRAIKISTTATEEEKQDKLEQLKAQRNAKLRTLITNKQITVMDEIYDAPNHKVYPPGQPTADND